MVILLINIFSQGRGASDDLKFSEFKREVRAGNIAEITRRGFGVAYAGLEFTL